MGDYDGHPFRGNQYTKADVEAAAYSARGNALDSLVEEGLQRETEEWNRREVELMKANLAMAADQSRIPEDVLREHLGWPSRAEEAKWDAVAAEQKKRHAKMDRKAAREAAQEAAGVTVSRGDYIMEAHAKQVKKSATAFKAALTRSTKPRTGGGAFAGPDPLGRASRKFEQDAKLAASRALDLLGREKRS